MNTIERYYNQTAALMRVEELVKQDKSVWIWRDQLDGVPVWVVEFK